MMPSARGDRPRGGRVVAGDHHRRDAGRLAQADRLARLGARRVDQADQAEEGRGRVSTDSAASSSGTPASGAHATASTRSPSAAICSAARRARVRVEAARRPSAPQLRRRTARAPPSGAPLVKATTLVAVAVQRGHALALGVEGQLGERAAIAASSVGLVDARRRRAACEQRDLGRVAGHAAVGDRCGVVVERERREQRRPRLRRAARPSRCRRLARRPRTRSTLHAVLRSACRSCRSRCRSPSRASPPPAAGGSARSARTIRRAPSASEIGHHRRQRLGDRRHRQADGGERTSAASGSPRSSADDEHDARRSPARRAPAAGRSAARRFCSGVLTSLLGAQQARRCVPSSVCHAGGHHQAAPAAVGDRWCPCRPCCGGRRAAGRASASALDLLFDRDATRR